MTTSLSKGKKAVKGKIKGKAAETDNKKALHPLGYKAFWLSFVDKKDARYIWRSARSLC